MLNMMMNKLIDSQTTLQVVHKSPGRIRFRMKALTYIPAHKQELVESIEDILKAQPLINDITVNTTSGSILITYEFTTFAAETVETFVRNILQIILRYRDSFMNADPARLPELIKAFAEYVLKSTSKDYQLDPSLSIPETVWIQ